MPPPPPTASASLPNPTAHLPACLPACHADVIYVAGDRVVTDALCKPFSMGRNLFCVHSKVGGDGWDWVGGLGRVHPPIHARHPPLLSQAPKTPQPSLLAPSACQPPCMHLTSTASAEAH